MRKLSAAVAALAALLCGCSKHNAGSPYYCSYQSGNITYVSPVADSLLQCRDTVINNYGLLSMASYRTSQLTDSAAAGLYALATWSFTLVNTGSPAGNFAGTYSTDTGAGNTRSIEPYGDFRFYTSYDPHHGAYYLTPGLTFTVTITQYAGSWFEGTFGGKVLQTNGITGATDTATITGGKFKLPLTP
jgi:hypothetical protein